VKTAEARHIFCSTIIDLSRIESEELGRKLRPQQYLKAIALFSGVDTRDRYRSARHTAWLRRHEHSL